MRQDRIHLRTVIAFAVFSAGSAAGLYADNWPQWRGPLGNSVSAETGLPTRWSDTEHIAWKCNLPEWGTSTPAIFGDAIFLTWSGLIRPTETGVTSEDAFFIVGGKGRFLGATGSGVDQDPLAGSEPRVGPGQPGGAERDRHSRCLRVT